MDTTNYIPITEEEYNILNAGIENNQHIWQKKTGELLLRDAYTKYDAVNDTWVTDQDAINAEAQRKLITDTKAELDNTAYYDMPSYRSRLTDEQNKANDEYRAKLWDILESNSNLTTTQGKN